jgi:hypothetical protein
VAVATTTSEVRAGPGGTAADRDGTATTAVVPDGTMTMAADLDMTTGQVDLDGTRDTGRSVLPMID